MVHFPTKLTTCCTFYISLWAWQNNVTGCRVGKLRARGQMHLNNRAVSMFLYLNVLIQVINNDSQVIIR